MTSLARLDAIVEAKRARHPELGAPLTWAGFLAICDRERIVVREAPLPTDAVLLTALGTAVIVINSLLDVRRHTYRGAHELAHQWVHGPSEHVVYTMRDFNGPDVREDDAEYVATRILQGW